MERCGSALIARARIRSRNPTHSLERSDATRWKQGTPLQEHSLKPNIPIFSQLLYSIVHVVRLRQVNYTCERCRKRRRKMGVLNSSGKGVTETVASTRNDEGDRLDQRTRNGRSAQWISNGGGGKGNETVAVGGSIKRLRRIENGMNKNPRTTKKAVL